jgi:hypothetical protein
VSGVGADGLLQIASECSGAWPEPLTLAEGPTTEILSNLPPIHQIAETLPVFSVPASCSLELFDLGTGKWSDVSDASRPGAYRLHLRPIRYGYMSASATGERRMRLVDNRLGKHLAASSSQPLVAYDPSKRLLSTPLGAQLPGLYERALVLATGIPPQQLTNGTVAYEGVSSDVAARVWHLLISTDEGQ